MNNNIEALKKEFNTDHAPRQIINRDKQSNEQNGDDLAMAIYDGGDPNSRHNQIVRAIEMN